MSKQLPSLNWTRNLSNLWANMRILKPYEQTSIAAALKSETQNYNRKYFDELIEKLMADAKVEYPPVLLDDEINHMLVHFEQDLSRQKLDLDTYLKTREMTREELIDKEIKPSAELRVKRQLVLEKFAAEENIQI